MNTRILFSVGIIVLAFLGFFALQPSKQEPGGNERITRSP
jgi:hypothetical protein